MININNSYTSTTYTPYTNKDALIKEQSQNASSPSASLNSDNNVYAKLTKEYPNANIKCCDNFSNTSGQTTICISPLAMEKAQNDPEEYNKLSNTIKSTTETTGFIKAFGTFPDGTTVDSISYYIDPKGELSISVTYKKPKWLTDKIKKQKENEARAKKLKEKKYKDKKLKEKQQKIKRQKDKKNCLKNIRIKRINGNKVKISQMRLKRIINNKIQHINKLV